jgi:hypothetical protein
MDPALLAVASLFVAIIGVAINGYNSRTALKHSQIAAESRMTAIETKLGILWRLTEAKLVDSLHHPDDAYARADYLLEQYLCRRLTEDEKAELLEQMRARAIDQGVDRYERAAAKALLTVLETPEAPARRLTDAVVGPPIIELLAPARTVRSLLQFWSWWYSTHGQRRKDK